MTGKISCTSRSISVMAAAFVSFALIAVACAQTVLAVDPVNGKHVFLAAGCFECHGRLGQGGAFLSPAPVIAGIELPEESFIAFLRNAPNDMPTYSAEVLPDREAKDIYAFLRALPGRTSAKDISILNE
ncbi:MAG: cytochrome c [Rhodomicrobium sp.]|jgi:mono/diheme cytochrome c family protein